MEEVDTKFSDLDGVISFDGSSDGRRPSLFSHKLRNRTQPGEILHVNFVAKGFHPKFDKKFNDNTCISANEALITSSKILKSGSTKCQKRKLN